MWSVTVIVEITSCADKRAAHQQLMHIEVFLLSLNRPWTMVGVDQWDASSVPKGYLNCGKWECLWSIVRFIKCRISITRWLCRDLHWPNHAHDLRPDSKFDSTHPRVRSILKVSAWMTQTHHNTQNNKTAMQNNTFLLLLCYCYLLFAMIRIRSDDLLPDIIKLNYKDFALVQETSKVYDISKQHFCCILIWNLTHRLHLMSIL